MKKGLILLVLEHTWSFCLFGFCPCWSLNIITIFFLANKLFVCWTFLFFIFEKNARFWTVAGPLLWFRTRLLWPPCNHPCSCILYVCRKILLHRVAPVSAHLILILAISCHRSSTDVNTYHSVRWIIAYFWSSIWNWCSTLELLYSALRSNLLQSGGILTRHKQSAAEFFPSQVFFSKITPWSWSFC